MVTLAQDGPAVFRDRYELLSRHRAEGPNALWQADHTLLDVMVLDANGDAVRPWLTIIRWASRRVRRAQGAATVGRRSVKMRRGQERLRQNHLRTRSCKRTRYCAQGKSARVRP